MCDNLGFKVLKNSLYPHGLMYFHDMGLGYNDPWVELHICDVNRSKVTKVKGYLGVIDIWLKFLKKRWSLNSFRIPYHFNPNPNP